MNPGSRFSRLASSKSVAWICGCIVAFWVLYRPPQNPISWDVFGYYYYLPSAAFHGGPVTDNVEWLEEVNEKYKSSGTLYQVYRHDNGKWIDKYAMGMSVMYLPGFLGGHLAAMAGAGETDGFSEPYQWGMILICLFYSLLSIALLRKILLKYFSDRVSALTLVLVVLGTNYFHNAAFSSSMPHNVIFLLYAGVIWYTIRWHEEGRWKHLLLLAASSGLAILCRPTELLCLLIPLLWGVRNLETARSKMEMLWRRRYQLAAFALVLLAIGFPQMLYWKKSAGEWLYFSYGNNAGEGFEFGHPFLLEVLFSYRKGWLVYTPVMVFALAGMAWLGMQRRELLAPVLIFFFLNLYVVSSWSCWWYADSFGHRALVQSYPLLALPLAAFLTGVGRAAPGIRAAMAVPLIFFVALNGFQTWQLENGILHTSRMTGPYYWRIFGKTRLQPGDEKLLLLNRSYNGPEIFSDPDERYDSRILSFSDYEAETDENLKAHVVDSPATGNGKCLKLDKEFHFTPAVKQKFRDLTRSDHAWVRLSCQLYVDTPIQENKIAAVFTFTHEGKSYKYNAMVPIPASVKIHQWNNLYFDYLTPEVRSADDQLETYLWLQGDKPLWVDNLEVRIFEPKLE